MPSEPSDCVSQAFSASAHESCSVDGVPQGHLHSAVINDANGLRVYLDRLHSRNLPVCHLMRQIFFQPHCRVSLPLS